MTAVPAGTTWLEFTEFHKIPTSSGGFYLMFRNRPSICVCKTDQRFVYLIQDELDVLERGDTVRLACIKDPDPQRVDHWRISLLYYEARYADTLQEQQAEQERQLEPTYENVLEQTTTSTKPSKHITCKVSLEDHALLNELYKKAKIVHGECIHFGDFVAALLTRQLEVVKLLHTAEPQLPF
jgi:hypothetical protein